VLETPAVQEARVKAPKDSKLYKFWWNNFRWPTNGMIITLKFLPHHMPDKTEDRVRAALEEWKATNLNLKFEWKKPNEDANIRIQLLPNGGSICSYRGQDALNVTDQTKVRATNFCLIKK
jgi:hypothetical protein